MAKCSEPRIVMKMLICQISKLDKVRVSESDVSACEMRRDGTEWATCSVIMIACLAVMIILWSLGNR